MKKHFFAITIEDDSKSYHPKTRTILDIPTAINFFGNADLTLKIVGGSVRSMCDKWNDKYEGKKEVK